VESPMWENPLWDISDGLLEGLMWLIALRRHI